MRFLALISLLFAPAAPAAEEPTAEEIIKIWEQQAESRGAIDVQWGIVRDSRSRGFGLWTKESNPRTPAREGRLWLEGKQGRVDQHCLLVPGQDGHWHPRTWHPRENRKQFRHILLDEQLEGEYPMPEWWPISLPVSPSEPMPEEDWGELVRLASLAAILASRPDFALGAETIELMPRHRPRVMDQRMPVLKIQQGAATHDLIWVDPRHGYRIVRWLRTAGEYPSGQIDISYARGDSSRPASWTVLAFDARGNVLDFLTAEITNFQTNAEIPAETCTAAGASWNRLPRDNSPGSSTRSTLRWVVNTTWIQVLAVVAGVALIIAWQRWRQKPGNTASEGKSA